MNEIRLKDKNKKDENRLDLIETWICSNSSSISSLKLTFFSLTFDLLFNEPLVLSLWGVRPERCRRSAAQFNRTNASSVCGREEAVWRRLTGCSQSWLDGRRVRKKDYTSFLSVRQQESQPLFVLCVCFTSEWIPSGTETLISARRRERLFLFISCWEHQGWSGHGPRRPTQPRPAG